MAVQLETVGESIALLLLLDTPAVYPEHIFKDHWDTQSTLMGMARDMAMELGETLPEKYDDQLRYVRDKMAAKNMIPPSTPIDWVERLVAQQSCSTVRVRNHRPGKCQSGLIFVRAELEQRPTSDEIYDWQPFTSGDVRNIGIPSKHDHMVSAEHVAQLSMIIQDAMTSGQSEQKVQKE